MKLKNAPVSPSRWQGPGLRTTHRLRSMAQSFQKGIEIGRFRQLHPVRGKFEPCLTVGCPHRALCVQLALVRLTTKSLCGCFRLHGIDHPITALAPQFPAARYLVAHRDIARDDRDGHATVMGWFQIAEAHSFFAPAPERRRIKRRSQRLMRGRFRGASNHRLESWRSRSRNSRRYRD